MRRTKAMLRRPTRASSMSRAAEACSARTQRRETRAGTAAAAQARSARIQHEVMKPEARRREDAPATATMNERLSPSGPRPARITATIAEMTKSAVSAGRRPSAEAQQSDDGVALHCLHM